MILKFRCVSFSENNNVLLIPKNIELHVLYTNRKSGSTHRVLNIQHHYTVRGPKRDEG